MRKVAMDADRILKSGSALQLSIDWPGRTVRVYRAPGGHLVRFDERPRDALDGRRIRSVAAYRFGLLVHED